MRVRCGTQYNGRTIDERSNRIIVRLSMMEQKATMDTMGLLWHGLEPSTGNHWTIGAYGSPQYHSESLKGSYLHHPWELRPSKSHDPKITHFTYPSSLALLLIVDASIEHTPVIED